MGGVLVNDDALVGVEFAERLFVTPKHFKAASNVPLKLNANLVGA